MSKLLLIWEWVPEKTSVFELDAASNAAELARQSAGVFINSVGVEDDHPIHQLNVALEGAAELGIDAVLKGPYEDVVVCGFLM